MAGECLEGARRKLEEAALQYARMSKLGEYLSTENGHTFRNRVCATDIPHYIGEFERQLKQAAIDLLSELSAQPLPEREASNDI